MPTSQFDPETLIREGLLACLAHREAAVDYCRTFGLIVIGPEDRIVGHAFYTELSEDRAEVAFAIAYDYQGRGLGSILLLHLAEVAAANGIQVFEAETIAANTAMLRVFRESGFHTEVKASAGQLQVSFPTSFTDEAIQRFERRESIASV